ncbi:hypothetical protein Tsubulata_014362 [Turnera subulata]|uniref:BHLH domain-containing protein n=1 Tax=Turnera subulata TaxID=218843 RepID=A0A9Q0F4U2_9ROSI|nr:hypothetical protein Tsubulata_014362 [Turnera subulata]
MEPIGDMLEGGWGSLSGMYTTEEADFMAQLLGNFTHPNQVDSIPNLGFSSFWPSHESSISLSGANQDSFYSSDIGNTNLYNFSQESSSYSGGSSIHFPTSSQENHYLSDSLAIPVNKNSSMSMDYCIGDGMNAESYLVEGDDCSNQEGSDPNVENSATNLLDAALADDSLALQHKKGAEIPTLEPSEDDKSKNKSENSKKRSRTTENVSTITSIPLFYNVAPKYKRNVRSKRGQKLVPSGNDDEESNAVLNRPASSCCSDDDSNASLELTGGRSSSMSSKETSALNLNGKTRASRGAATDPQSLYARKRRERINERLRILQNLVPNGTKVDISTMLEEAVQYVKFLQLQIKLLSSDDLWMYAPIAYNGMNIGLDLRVPTPSPRS